jgi:hypothetical protein
VSDSAYRSAGLKGYVSDIEGLPGERRRKIKVEAWLEGGGRRGR